MTDTCEACGSEYNKKRSDQRFCRRQCSQRYAMMHNPRGCDEPDCDKPHRAKGYCHACRMVRQAERRGYTPRIDYNTPRPGSASATTPGVGAGRPRTKPASGLPDENRSH